MIDPRDPSSCGHGVGRGLMRTLRWLVIGLAVVSVSCGSYALRLARLNDDGEFSEVISDGEAWLTRHADERETAEWAAVHREQARAALSIAHRTDTFAAYMGFEEEFPAAENLEDLRTQSREWRAAAELRDMIIPSHDPEQFARFRARNAGTVAVERAWTLEAQVAFELIERSGTSLDFSRFCETYGDAPGAEPLVVLARRRAAELELEAILRVPSTTTLRGFSERHASNEAFADLVGRARTSESQMAFARAVRLNTAERYEAFVGEYGSWPEAATFVEDARNRHAELALALAVSTGTVDALETFRGAHPTEPWPSRVDLAIGELLLRPLQRELEGGERVTHSDADDLVSHLATYGARISASRPDAETAFRRARARDDAALWRCFVALYPESTHRDYANQAMRRAVFAEARPGATAATFLRVLRLFPEEPEATDVEGRLRFERERAHARERGHSVEVARTRTTSGETEVSFVVSDCSGQTVVGLRQDAFRVLDGDRPLAISSFLGMEQERPLSIEVALDLSGSMAVEREAVRRSVERFVDTLRFRGRAARIGLIGYSDRVIADARPASAPNEFLRALDNLPANVGGASEDGAGALMRATDALTTERGDRIVVLLSDEPLQTNAGGLHALGVNQECRDVLAVNNCVNACRTPDCTIGCFSRLGGTAAIEMRRCAHRFGAGSCLASIRQVLNQGVVQCGDASGLVAPLVRRLEAQRIRPYFVVSDATGSVDPFGAYRTLATLLGGSVEEVPNDARIPDPYSTALIRIADSLSREYTLTFSGASSAGGAGPSILVQPAHDWLRTPFESRTNTIIARVGGTETCPTLLSVPRGGPVLRSLRCGQAWEATGTQTASTPPAIGRSDEVTVVTEDEQLMTFVGAGSSSRSAPGLDRFRAPTYDASGRLWALATAHDTDHALAFTPDGHVSFDLAVPAGAIAFAMVPTASDATVCVVREGDHRVCTSLDGTAWDELPAAGFPATAFASSLIVDAGYPLTLVTTNDGAVFRSIDRGKTFHEVLRTSEPSPPTLAIAPSGDAICVGAGVRVLCSENGAVDWTEVGSASEAPGSASPFFSGARLLAARGGNIAAAALVVNRELPGNAALFDTGSDTPRRGAAVLLADTARLMSSDASLTLRIEGHTDSRGDASDNEALAARRAERVAELLLAAGVPRARIEVVSFGERRPLRRESTSAAHERNRRVELILLTPMSRRGWYGNRCDEDLGSMSDVSNRLAAE